jgi:hypothetical protein
MIRCSVHFYRKILGVPFSVAQGTVEIGCARDEARAVLAAQRRFERRLGIQDWKMRADSFDISTKPVR